MVVLLPLLFLQAFDTIEKNAFFGCSDLESIIFLGEVPPKSIGEAAFEPDYYYANITVTVPAGTKAAYESALENAAAFYYGTEWTVVEAGGSTDPVDPDPAPVEKEIFTYSTVEGGVAITGPGKDFALSSENRVETITVPDTIGGQPVIGIASGAFKEKFVGSLYGGANSGVRVITVKLPETVQYIDDDAFSGCQGLAAVNMPRDLKRIGERAFYNCKNLVDAEFPAGLELIEYGAFWNCFALKGNADGIIALPEGAKACAFSNCENMESIEVKNLKKDFKRSEFDCYAINLDGDYSKYGYWVEGVFYLYDDATISDIAGNQDNSGGAIGDLEKVNTEGEKFDTAASGATLVTADAGSIGVLCGCSVGGGGQFAATANPKFNYKTASSNTATSGGSAAGNAAKAAGRHKADRSSFCELLYHFFGIFFDYVKNSTVNVMV